jgi:hypothetical protein
MQDFIATGKLFSTERCLSFQVDLDVNYFQMTLPHVPSMTPSSLTCFILKEFLFTE